MKLSDRAGLALAALAAILFSAKAILAKLMYRYGVDATTVLSLRLAFAGPVFAAIALFEQRRARREGTQLPWRDVRLVLLLGLLGYYLSSFLDFCGLQYIPAALERLILFLTPTLVAAIGVLALKKTVTARQVQALCISYTGMVIVFWSHLRTDLASAVGTGHASTLGLGSALCFAAACSYAVYLVLSGELVQRLGSLRLVAYAMCTSTVLTLLHFCAFAVQPLHSWPWQVYGLSAANALFCTVVPVYLTMFCVQSIGAARTSQLSMLGPISLLFLGAWLLQEHITALQVLGTAVVLTGVWRVMSVAPHTAKLEDSR
jgi:drug/metabolite transporter (DMT)-like permease